MIQGRDGAGFALEALGEILLGDFDSDDPVEARVTGPIHFAHTARTDGREEFIGAESCTSSERHLDDKAKFSRSRSG